MKRALALVAVPALAISLAACGDDGSDDAKGPMSGRSMPASASPSDGGSQARHNDQDVMFAQMMIPHHRQAVEMADLAATRAASPEVKQLAAEIKKAQDPEIEQMSAWLTGWGAPVPSPGVSDPGHMGHGGMEGMMTDEQMKDLEGAEGAAFDRAFLTMMIKHHEGAVAMAGTEQTSGRSPEAKKMAADIVTSQSAEITRMRKLLKQ
ncbi:DUF305 domain-containing protein [Actinomadura monticuli]|uniref:DUF305 domain-containing protein n=1 Tax=Actinomadura monticuli TaxID=3097367 RepID=A0ABV4QJ39_9ACTN